MEIGTREESPDNRIFRIIGVRIIEVRLYKHLASRAWTPSAISTERTRNKIIIFTSVLVAHSNCVTEVYVCDLLKVQRM